MTSVKCSHCGCIFEPVWFQREDLRVRRARHELRCVHKTPAERDYYRRFGRWKPAESTHLRKAAKGRGATRKAQAVAAFARAAARKRNG